MPNPTHLLLWTDGPTPYTNAIAESGLASRVTVDVLPRKDQPSEAQRAQAEAMLAWGAPPGLLPGMPNLRWAQALTAGVEGWLALPDLPPRLTLTCARGTHRESMPENILGALFYLTKPYAACVEDQKQSKWTRRVATPLTGQTLGILGLGAVGQDVARLGTALGMKVIGTKRNPTPLPGLAEVYPPERTNDVLAQSDFVVLLLPATPATAYSAINRCVKCWRVSATSGARCCCTCCAPAITGTRCCAGWSARSAPKGASRSAC